MKARSLMTPHPCVVLPDEPVLKAAETMRDHDIGAVPVVDGRESMRLVGVVTDRDLVVRHLAAGHPDDCRVREHMTTVPLVTVRPGAGVDEVLEVMRERRVRRVMVTDGEGVLRGVIAQADLLRLEGHDHPRRVERVLETISEPAAAPV